MNNIRRPATLLTLLVIVACGGGGDGTASTTSTPVTAGSSLLTPTGTSAPPSDGGSDAVEASIALFTFDPEVVTVGAGGTVTWTNTDQILHTVTSGTPEAPAGDFDEVVLDGQGTTGSITFTEPGTFEFFCARHTQMRVTVEAGTS